MSLATAAPSILVLGDPLGDVLGVVLDPADQRRAARVLPGEAEEVEAGDIGDAAAVAQAPVLVEDRQLDPGVVGAIARRPDDGVDLELAAVFEANRVPVGVDDARLDLDPVALLELAWARADQRVARASLRPSRESTVLSRIRAFVSHQKRSRPSTRWGSGFWREPTESTTLCVADSSFAI